MAREGIAPVIVVVNNGGYTVERAIHGADAYYNDIPGWCWTEVPHSLGVIDALTFTVRTAGELDSALAAAAAHRDRMILLEVILHPDDVPPLLEVLAQSAAAANNTAAALRSSARRR